jgi:hypothetical protein
VKIIAVYYEFMATMLALLRMDNAKELHTVNVVLIYSAVRELYLRTLDSN